MERGRNKAAAWRFVTPILKAWEEDPTGPEAYPALSWGPPKADELLARSGRSWHIPKMPTPKK